VRVLGAWNAVAVCVGDRGLGRCINEEYRRKQPKSKGTHPYVHRGACLQNSQVLKRMKKNWKA